MRWFLWFCGIAGLLFSLNVDNPMGFAITLIACAVMGIAELLGIAYRIEKHISAERAEKAMLTVKIEKLEPKRAA